MDKEVQRPRLELVTKPNCSLCGAARAAVERVASGLGLEWQELSLSDASDSDSNSNDADNAGLARFAEEVPVVLVNGVQRDFWTVDEARLRRILTEAGA